MHLQPLTQNDQRLHPLMQRKVTAIGLVQQCTLQRICTLKMSFEI
ncbi:MAG: hypothetical protein ACI8Z5_001189 [Lentimonas sp.]|jgi:hypothetical protein